MSVLLAAPAEQDSPGTAEPWRARLQPLVGPGGWAATLAVTLLAGLLRFVRLDLPHNGPTSDKIFDEIYYACDAQNLLRYGVEHATLGGDRAGECVPTGTGSFVVHPPLGKWAIALGMKAFGVDTFGWRFSAAVVGTLTVLVVVRAARRMTGSTLLGCLAGLLLSLDGLHFVLSRVAMLDMFLVLWTTSAFACLLCDRQQVRSRLARAPATGAGAGPPTGVRCWRVAAGVCVGAACATKWSGVYYLALLAVLAVGWETGARRTAGVRAPLRATLRRSALPTVLSLVLLPVAVYLLSWIGWFRSDIGWGRHWADDRPSGLPIPGALRSLWHYHHEVYAFHEQLSLPHSYQSHPAGWLLLARPVSYYYPPGIGRGRYGCDAASCAREVLAVGNPALWWAAIPVLLALTWLWVSRRDWRAGALVPLVLAAIVPWVRDDLQDRTMFLFYALPAVPFMAIGTALVAGWVVGGRTASLERRRVGAAAVGCYVALVVLAFGFFYPVLAAQTIPLHHWQDRMWLDSWV